MVELDRARDERVNEADRRSAIQQSPSRTGQSLRYDLVFRAELAIVMGDVSNR